MMYLGICEYVVSKDANILNARSKVYCFTGVCCCASSSRFLRCNGSCLSMQCHTVTQVLSNDAVTAALDLWALGCIIYQMLVGKAPFKAASEYLTFQLIADASYSFPAHPALPPAAEDIIRKLLVVDAGARLGACACLQRSISTGLPIPSVDDRFQCKAV